MSHGLKVATFNVENLNSPGTAFVGRPGDKPYDPSKFAEKVRFISSKLDDIGADIVGFQEVFDQDALRTAVEASTMRGAHIRVPMSRIVPDALTGRPVADGPNVGIASRFPFTKAPEVVRDFPADTRILIPTGLHGLPGDIVQLQIQQFERPVLRAEIDVPGLPGLVVLVVHLKSKRGKFLPGEDENNPALAAVSQLRSLIVRAAEACALRSLIRSIRNERASDGRRRPLIVLGDLNDDIDAVTTRMLEGSQPFAEPGEKVPRGPYASKTSDLMINALEAKPPADGTLYSHVFNGRGTLIDTILVSGDFLPIVKRQRAVIVETGIVIDHLPEAPRLHFVLPPPQDSMPDPLDDPAPRSKAPPKDPSTRSDHGIPFVTFRLLDPSPSDPHAAK